MEQLTYERMSEAELQSKPIGSQFCADVECFPNFFFVGFRCELTGKVYEIESSPSSVLDVDKLAFLITAFELITFNGRRYDLPMITLALQGWTAAQLHAASQRIIGENIEWWDFEKAFDVRLPPHVRHIDLCEVVPLNKSYGSSLKMRAAQMHMPTIQDLPVDPLLPIPDAQTADDVKRYCCGGDLPITSKLKAELREQLALRAALSADYGLDLMSRSDAQIAEAVIKKEIAGRTGRAVARPVNLRGQSVRFDPPLWMQRAGFGTAKLQAIFQRLQAQHFQIGETGTIQAPEWLNETTVEIGKGLYRMGIGGLHSQEEKISYKSNAQRVLIDRDVESYYPAIIINQELYPEHLGQVFCEVYTTIRDRRVEAKRQKNTRVANSLKIAVNGGFGKLNSPYSTLYAPKAFLQVVLTGQLSLLMLIEQFEAHGIQVVSANTDGIVTYCPRDLEDTMLQLIRSWEAFSGFKTEETRYRAYHARDVNNYVAVKESGEVKSKGAFGNPWTGDTDPIFRFHKNPDALVCVMALHAFLAHRTPLESTIRACQDPSLFAVVRRVKGGAEKGGRVLGKVCRWYYSTDSPGPLQYLSNGNAVADSEGGCPMQTLPDALPPDLDFARYIAIARGMLDEVGFYFQRQNTLW